MALLRRHPAHVLPTPPLVPPWLLAPPAPPLTWRVGKALPALGRPQNGPGSGGEWQAAARGPLRSYSPDPQMPSRESRWYIGKGLARKPPPRLYHHSNRSSICRRRPPRSSNRPYGALWPQPVRRGLRTLRLLQRLSLQQRWQQEQLGPVPVGPPAGLPYWRARTLLQPRRGVCRRAPGHPRSYQRSETV